MPRASRVRVGATRLTRAILYIGCASWTFRVDPVHLLRFFVVHGTRWCQRMVRSWARGRAHENARERCRTGQGVPDPGCRQTGNEQHTQKGCASARDKRKNGAGARAQHAKLSRRTVVHLARDSSAAPSPPTDGCSSSWCPPLGHAPAWCRSSEGCCSGIYGRGLQDWAEKADDRGRGRGRGGCSVRVGEVGDVRRGYT